MGKEITPTVKRQIGATTINIDSRVMKNLNLLINSRIFLKSHAYLYLFTENRFKNFFKLLSKTEKKIKKYQFFHKSSY